MERKNLETCVLRLLMYTSSMSAHYCLSSHVIMLDGVVNLGLSDIPVCLSIFQHVRITPDAFRVLSSHVSDEAW